MATVSSIPYIGKSRPSVFVNLDSKRENVLLLYFPQFSLLYSMGNLEGLILSKLAIFEVDIFIECKSRNYM